MRVTRFMGDKSCFSILECGGQLVEFVALSVMISAAAAAGDLADHGGENFRRQVGDHRHGRSARRAEA